MRDANTRACSACGNVGAVDDSLCGHVRVISALPLGHGSHAFGAPSLAIDDDEGQRVWMVRVEREFVPDDVEMSRFLNGVGELARADVDALVPLVLLDRELDFAVVGWQAMEGAVAIVGRGGSSIAALRDNAARLAEALAVLHTRGRVHGMACPANVVRTADGRAWWWMYGVADCVDHTAFLAVPPRPAEGLAPEIARGEISAASDVYGWATALVVLAHAGTLQECIAAARAGAGVFGQDPALTALLVRALDPEPGRRPADGEALRSALQPIIGAGQARGAAAAGVPPTLAGGAPPTPGALAPGRALASVARAAPPSASISIGAALAPGDSLADLGGTAGSGASPPAVGWGGGSASMGLPLPQRPVAQRDAISLDEAPPLDLPEPVDLDAPDDSDAAESLEAGVLELAEDGPIVSAATANIYASFDRALSRFEDEDAAPGVAAIALDDGVALPLAEPARGAAGSTSPSSANARHAGQAAHRTGGAEPNPQAEGPRIGGLRAGEVPTPALAATPGFARPIDAPLEVVEVRVRRSGPRGPSNALMNVLAWSLAAVALGLGVAALVGKIALPTAPRATPANAAGAVGETSGETATGSASPDEGDTATPDGGGTTTGEAPLVLDDPDPPPPRPCPTGTVELSDDACIDVGEYPGLRRMPTRNVTYAEAEATCKARDARLCSLDEWRTGCGGPTKQRFPYGASFVRGACNVASIAGFYGEAVQAGSYAECVSPLGALDMVGNVGEWVAGGVAVGGDFGTSERDATCQAKGNPPKGYSGGEVGFRCCVDRRSPAPVAGKTP